MNTLSHSANSENWEETVANSGYTHSEVEKYMKESYQQGYNDKDEEIRLRITEIFETNRDLTDKISTNLFEYLKTLGVKPVSAFMKVGSIFNYSILVSVTIDDYVSDNILKAYNWAHEAEKVSRNAHYNLDISFIYEDEHLNIDCLNSDGFRFRHKTISGK